MRTIAYLLLFAAFVYTALALAVYAFQGGMVFLADIPGRTLTASPANLGLGFEDVSIRTSDNERLHGWYVPANRARGVVLFLHGNAGNISHRLESIATFHGLGLDVLIIDYRGYGQSTGRPGENGLYLDSEAAWDYLVSQRNVEPGRIIIFGRSLGGAVGARLASRQDAGGLIMESVFTSGVDMARRLYRFLPARLITRLEFPVMEFVSGIRCPVLVIHSRDDEIVPFDMGESVFEAVRSQRKSFLEMHGGHNTGFILSQDIYLPALEEFTRRALHLDSDSNPP
jgi:fermentation-respiration switch protein FrsA (DUF1100 family)